MSKFWTLCSLLKQGRLEVLSRKTITGDRSRAYLLGVIHRRQDSINNSKLLVELLRPNTLFLEYDHYRRIKYAAHDDTSEFIAARDVAHRLGIDDVVYGDMDIRDTEHLYDDRVKELEQIMYPHMDVKHIGEEGREEIKSQAKDDIVRDLRDRYMVDGLLRIDTPVILGIVGRGHLEGMKRYWEEKIGLPQNSWLNLF